MKINRLIPIMLLLTITLMGCKKDGNAGDGLSKDEMNFTAGSSPNTKTVYDKKNPWQINWIEGDQITVFCEQAGNKKQAAYDVTPIAATPHKGTITLALSESPDNSKERRTGLRWRTGKHNVYSVYPSLDQSGGNIKKTGEGKFTFNFPQTQYCSKDGVTPVGGNYMLNPNMYLAYMVAKNEGLDPLSFVELLFRPIATTLEITVRGAAQTGTAELNSLELKVKNLAGQYVKKSGTNYQVQFDAKQTYTTPTTAVSDALTPYTSGAVATADFSIKVTGGTAFQLNANESVTFTVFLPPIKNLDDVEVKCMGSGNIELGKKQILTNVQYASPASKRRITLSNVVVAPDSIKVLPADDINLATRPYTSGDIVLKYGLTQQLKAIAYYPNGTDKVITSDAGTAWSSNLTNISEVNTTDNKGLVTLINVGTSKITATYQGVKGTATIRPQVYRTFTINDYYQWDAYEHFGLTNFQNAPWQPGSSSYNPVNTVDEPDAVATQSCKNAPTMADTERYLGNGVNLSATDGLIYILQPDGTGGKLYCNGLWLKKWANHSASATPQDKVLSSSPLNHKGRPSDSEISKWFFLPSCGLYVNSFNPNRGEGEYWLSSPIKNNQGIQTIGAYLLLFNSSSNSNFNVLLDMKTRGFGYVPLVGFDDTYNVKIELTANPNSIPKGKSSALKAVVTYADRTQKTNPPGISFTSSNTSVIPNPGTTASAKGSAVGYSDITASITLNGATIKSNAVRITVTPAVATEIVSFTASPNSILTGEQSNLIAKVKYSDGTTQTNPSGITFTSNNTGVIPNPGAATTATGYTAGTAVITAKFGSLPTKTVTITVATRSYTADDYYMWDAPIDEPYSTTVRGNYHNFNVNNINGQANQSCANAPTYYEIRMYLAAGVYWVEDGPEYKLPDGEVYRTGLMVKKKENIRGFDQGNAAMAYFATPTKGVSYQTLKNDYFFLPACGSYNETFGTSGGSGYYWSSSGTTEGTAAAYCLGFDSDRADVHGRGGCLARWNGFLPMPRK